MLIILFLLMLIIPMSAHAQTWEVTYYVTTDMANTHGFYGAGTYDLLKRDGYIPVYLKRENWDFIGMYGQVALPADFPSIQFTGLYDQAIVSPGSGGGGGAVVAMPELAILRRMTKHIGGRQLAALANPPLQRATAWGAALVLGAQRIDNRIMLSSVTLDVVEWCSGLETMKWLVALATLCLVLHRVSWRWRLALLGAAPLIAVEVNILRVAAVGVGFEHGYGWGIKESLAWGATMFGIAQVSLIAWLGCMRRRA